MRKLLDTVFGVRVDGHLPQRVRRSIAEQQVQAEVLIGWFQLALVVFFIVLYTLAPKTSEGTPFTPVPFALAAYLLFTLLRLSVARRRALPRWFVLTSVVGDIGLLMVLIWSFHLQYQQPAPFYLKAPTLLYVFIFISLRTLRFDPLYVLTAGLAAALGWLGLVGYAIWEMRGPEMEAMDVVTRDYVLYMTSSRVLIGAEIDKVISIMLVSAVLAVALVRARRLLIKAVVDATTAEDLSRFLPPEVADHITTADTAIQPGDARVKTASILFCDIEGFSGISERVSPGELMQMLNEYFAVVSEVIDRHGGVITQFQGDAMLITFNTVKPDLDHAASALSTALGIQRVLAGRRFGAGHAFRTRCGVNSGEIILGAVGTGQRMLFTVYGDEVNIAARLEQLNKTYGTYILATEQTVRAAGGSFRCDAIGSILVRGRKEPVVAYTCDAPPATLERLRAAAMTQNPPEAVAETRKAMDIRP
jgi:adenylate cyclase